MRCPLGALLWQRGGMNTWLYEATWAPPTCTLHVTIYNHKSRVNKCRGNGNCDYANRVLVVLGVLGLVLGVLGVLVYELDH
jgi:hypothetical protein